MRDFFRRVRIRLAVGWLRFRTWVVGALISLGLIAGLAMAAEKNFSWTNPTMNVDGSLFDAATEQQETRIYCSNDIQTDFNNFVPETPGNPQALTPTLVVPGAATAAVRDFTVGYYECFATVVSIYGYESDTSNLTQFDITPTIAPQGITDFSVD